MVETAQVYFEVGARIGIDWLRDQIERLSVEGPWQAIARAGLRDTALRIHRRLAERVLSRKDRGAPQARVTAWVESVGEDPRSLATYLHRDARVRPPGGMARPISQHLRLGVESVRKLAD